MALKEISLSSLVDLLDETQSEYADFFRPMLGYDAFLKLYDGIGDEVEPLLVEIEDETGFEFPTDLVSFYMCTNGGTFGDMELFPITTDTRVSNNIHTLNVINKELKESLGLDNTSLLIGKYNFGEMYVVCKLNDNDEYTYQVWDANKKDVNVQFEVLAQLVAMEVSYVADYDGLMEYVNSPDEEE